MTAYMFYMPNHPWPHNFDIDGSTVAGTPKLCVERAKDVGYFTNLHSWGPCPFQLERVP